MANDEVTSTSNLEHGDPERVTTMRSYQDPNYLIRLMTGLDLDLRRENVEWRASDEEEAYEALGELVEIWTQPLRSEAHLRNSKFRLEREWKEFYDAIDRLVKAAVASDPNYAAWLREHPLTERKS